VYTRRRTPLYTTLTYVHFAQIFNVTLHPVLPLAFLLAMAGGTAYSKQLVKIFDADCFIVYLQFYFL